MHIENSNFSLLSSETGTTLVKLIDDKVNNDPNIEEDENNIFLIDSASDNNFLDNTNKEDSGIIN